MDRGAFACFFVPIAAAFLLCTACDRGSRQDGSTSVLPAGAHADPLEGEDFIAQARELFRVAACGDSAELPAGLDATVVARHCDELRLIYREYQKTFVEIAEPFFASHRPRDLPAAVVYPFGGGDLASALATFPEAAEITTISLEPAGDIRSVGALPPARLRRELAAHRSRLERLYDWGYSRTDNLRREASATWPGEVLFALAALVVQGDEPLGLRYFWLRPDGSIAYVTRSDIAREAHDPRAVRGLFDNVELSFRKANDPAAPIRLFRHIAMDLDDAHWRAAPSLRSHLDKKGTVCAMTKAASHLLWSDEFALVRGWLLDHVVWMASDSTGLPPRFAQASGFTQDAYGEYGGRPWGMTEGQDGADLSRLFASQPRRDLGFYYGYPDKNGHAYLLITRR